MRVCVTGGRTFRDRRWLWEGLNLLHTKSGGITEIIEGGAPGADVCAHEWAHWMNEAAGTPIIKLTTVDAEWEKHSKGLKQGQKNPAGMIRNNEMAKMRPDVVLATPGGKGTEHMVGVCKKLGLRVIFLEKMPVLKSPADPTSDGALP